MKFLRSYDGDTAKGTRHIVALDVASESSIKQSVGVVKKLLGEDAGLDYLYNNAAINESNDSAFTFDPDVLRRTMESNLIGLGVLAQVYLHLLEKGQKKTIVNMLSGLASLGLDLGGKSTTYSISKTALNMLTYKQKVERLDFTVIALGQDRYIWEAKAHSLTSSLQRLPRPYSQRSGEPSLAGHDAKDELPDHEPQENFGVWAIDWTTPEAHLPLPSPSK
ncbi:hypothetical protein C8Q76DRAFT_803441 [Earliella scabrosa]|nr:hypothetical protein C8Q76DRAFT_803441 [Earliella scabrosa]